MQGAINKQVSSESFSLWMFRFLMVFHDATAIWDKVEACTITTLAHYTLSVSRRRY